MPKPMRLANDDLVDLDSAQDPLHERRRAQGGDLRREWDHDQVVEAELVEYPGLFIEGGEIRGAMIRVQHASRMRLVGDEHADGSRLASARNHGLEQRL